MANQNILGAPVLTNFSKTVYVDRNLGSDAPLVGRGSIGLPFQTLGAANDYLVTNSLNVTGSFILIYVKSGIYDEINPSLAPYTYIFAESNQTVIFQNTFGMDGSWATATGDIFSGMQNMNTGGPTNISFNSATSANSITNFSFSNTCSLINFVGQLAINVIVYDYYNMWGDFTISGLIYRGGYNQKSSVVADVSFNTDYNVIGDKVLNTGNLLRAQGGSIVSANIKNSFFQDLTLDVLSGSISLEIDVASFPNSFVNSGAGVTFTSTSDAINANNIFTPANYIPTAGAFFGANTVTGNLNGIDAALANLFKGYEDISGSFGAIPGHGYFVLTNATAFMPGTPANGTEIRFVNPNGITLEVKASNADFIAIGTGLSTADGTATSTTVGDSITLVYQLSSVTWFAQNAPQGSNWVLA